MVGNRSVCAMAVCTLALHATAMAAHRDAAAADADEASSDLVVTEHYHRHRNNDGMHINNKKNNNNNSNNVSRRRRKHVRRRGMERGRHDDDRIDGRGSGYPSRRRREERHDDYGRESSSSSSSLSSGLARDPRPATADIEGQSQYGERSLSSSSSIRQRGTPPTNVVVGDSSTNIRNALPEERSDSRRGRELSSGCSDLGYHPSSGSNYNGSGCSNDDEYPKQWVTNPGLKDKMFKTTAEDCCREFFKNPDCPVTDVCGGGGPAPSGNSNPGPSPASGSSSSSASSCKWHIAQRSADGCSNDNDYPPIWLQPEIAGDMFFDTADACCVSMLPGKACKHYDRGCSGSSSGGSTPSGGGGRPSQPRPTPWPTPMPKIYWVKETTGACVEDADDPKPHWIETSYSSYEECCPHARDSIACMASLPAAPVAPGSPTGRPTMKPFLFYVDPSTSMCVEDTEKKKPGWIEKIYPVYEQCCNMDADVRDKELCLRARPTMINGISFGTSAPTRSPPPGFYADPESGMCVSELVKPKPSNVDASFDNYSRCCILASVNPQTCLALDPLKLKEASSSATMTWAPTPTTPANYYLQEALATCANVNDVQNSGWIGTTFGEDYDACCKTSWDEAKCMAMKPSLSPTNYPTWAPSTPLPTETALCPNSYDPKSSVYGRESEVEVNLVVYRCKGHPMYCNKPDFQPPRNDPGPSWDSPSRTQSSGVIIVPNKNDEGDGDSGSLWKDAWERVSACVRSPTRAPSMIPTTASPTCKTRWHPGEINRRICTNSHIYPKIWDAPPLSDNYFVDTAEECCNKFYGGNRCRVKDVC
eukprot:CAMPEP_0181080846 /NCGR_PEP_ID=MMETSP1071-20121207/2789_1 /TAXON_ID=35127 /ORGANISM="Thalassiosira sp., Strain NH16" /LENGTH=817 /DNA_ID=CAMNT_0023162359 /DNA_START=45 /DNA_END=2498 /DNA_ORIENTATION=+